MAEDGEWNRKDAVLSDVTALKQYGVTREFIVEGIRAGKLEWREGSMHGNPYLRILRSQLEQFIAEHFGSEHLATEKSKSELRSIKTEITGLKRKLAALETRRAALGRKLAP
jgi:hypothetical protein